jgi:hypothetical protein
MTDARHIDLDNIDNCPSTGLCAGCEAETDLRPSIVSTPVGVYCTTLCEECIEADRLPKLSYLSAYEAVGEHCVHLGITLDDMADISRSQRK